MSAVSEADLQGSIRKVARSIAAPWFGVPASSKKQYAKNLARTGLKRASFAES